MERLMIKGDFMSRKRKTTTTTSTRAEKKKKPNTNTSEEVLLLPSLPDDLLVMIVARVPRVYYRTLSLVSKRLRSMVASPELYKVRSVLGLRETCLYVCLRARLGSYKWYTLNSKIISSSGGGYVLRRVPIMPPGDDDDDDDDYSPYNAHLVAVGSDIYNIIVEVDKTSSGVWILDCNTHTWRKAPSMPKELDELSARVLDRKIYVLGRYHQDGSWNKSFQVFNTDTQTWDLPCHGLKCHRTTFTLDGKLHAVTFSDGVFAFNSKQCRWDLVEQYPRVRDIMFSESYCEIDNVLYSVSQEGALRWYDTDKTSWRDLKGLVGMPKLPSPLGVCGSFAKLTGYGGGKMMVFWNRNLSGHLFQSVTIFCAEIALERRNQGDFWGKLEWYGSVLSVPVDTHFVKALPVTL